MNGASALEKKKQCEIFFAFQSNKHWLLYRQKKFNRKFCYEKKV